MKAPILKNLSLFFGLGLQEITPLRERIIYLKTTIFIALPFTLIFSIVNYLNNFPYLASAEMITGIFILIPALMLAGKSTAISTAEYLVLLYGLLVTKALALFGGIEGTGTLWVAAFPFIAFLLKGQKLGWYLCIVWLLVMNVDFRPEGYDDIFYKYPDGFSEQFMLSMLFYCLIAASFNLARSSFESLLVEQKESAEAESEFRTRFLANVSHEIRTPLNAIYNLVDFANESHDRQKQQQYLLKLKSSTRHLLNLLNNVLDFSKLEKNEMVIEQALFNVEDEFVHIQNMVGATCDARNIDFAIHIDPRMVQSVITDPLKMHQILSNLVSNAVKFTPDNGAVSMSCSVIAKKTKTLKAEFRVTDNGIGMTPVQQSVIFDSFKQADVSTTRQYGGTGLGLAIVKQLVELLGGDIRVESAKGQGSEFIVDMSFDIAPEKIAEYQQFSSLESAIDKHDLKGLSVLLVEDNDINQEIAVELLQQEKVDVTVAENGIQALKMLSTDMSFDVVLMDFNMPVMNGFEATTSIRRDLGLTELPIIGLSANVFPEDLQKGIDAGMNATISKPIIKEDLIAIICEYVDLSAARVDRLDTKKQEILVGGYDLSASCLADEPEMLNKVLRMFAERYQSFGKEMQAFLDNGQYDHARIEAHTIKGHFANFGLMDLHDMAYQLEQACSEQSDECHHLIENLSEKLKPFVEQVFSDIKVS